MPIPLFAVPNAPRSGNPNMQEGPRVDVEISSSARNLLQPGIKPGSLDGEAEGMQYVGEGLKRLGEKGGRLSAIAAHVNEVKARAQDQFSLSQADLIQQGARNAFQEQVAKEQTPPDQQGALWNTYLEKVPGQIEGLPMTPEAKAAAMQDYQKFSMNSTHAVTMSATAQWIENGSQVVTDSIASKLSNGQYEDAMATGESAVQSGIWTQQQWDHKRSAIEEQHKEQTFNNTMSYLADNEPKALVEDLETISAGNPDGKTTPIDDMFPDSPDRAVKVTRALNIAKSNLRAKQSEQRETGFNLIQSNQITSEKQLNDFLEGPGSTLDPKDAQALRKGLTNSVGVLDVAEFNHIRALATQYNPKQDPDGTEFAAIQRRIGAELPNEEASQVFSLLNAAAKPGTIKNADADSRVSQISGQFLSTGVFGSFLTGEAAKQLTGKALSDNLAAQQTAEIRRAKFDDAYNQWSQDNPGVDVETATKWAYDRMGAQLKAQKAAEPPAPPSAWSPRNWFKKETATISKVDSILSTEGTPGPEGDLPKKDTPDNALTQNGGVDFAAQDSIQIGQ